MDDDCPRTRSADYFDEDPCSNPQINNSIGEVVERLLDRRSILKSAAGTATWLMFGPALAIETTSGSRGASSPSSLTFEELAHGRDERAHVPAGYQMEVLLRWGDPITSAAPDFDPHQQSAGSQQQQFGYNSDFTAFLPLKNYQPAAPRGLLCVNHEYTNTNLMFPGIDDQTALANLSRELVDAEMAAHGHSVVEIAREKDQWRVVRDSRYNRRITAATPMTVSGPAAGHPRLQTADDPTGRRVMGTLNNCGGGVTPWGTMLICEENFNGYFSGDASATPEARNHKRYAVGGPSRFNAAWAKHYARFDLEQTPHEPNRFGWVFEFDPFDPASVPVKRTALGRFKHEGAGVVVNHDGRVVIYSGDDERFEYVYRFVTNKAFDPRGGKANRDLLDDGTLSVAKFDDDGTMRWLPLVFGQGPLTPSNDFHSQADVLIETRRAADLLGATPMDRPEDVEASPNSHHVFVILTNNNKRPADKTDKANPRAANEHGHILELIPPALAAGFDHAATEFHWDVFLRAGDPGQADDAASYHPGVSDNGWFSSPDNCAFDDCGRMWLTTDSDAELTGFGDGIYAMDTQGAGRALPKLFFRGPRGSEVSGISLTPDNETLFVSVQHPAEEKDSNFQKPSTRWPDFKTSLPPRPAVVAITRRGGGKVGR